jgi:hypothetical protein
MASLPKIGAPASRALASIGITTLEAAAGRSKTELLALHGIGPKAIRLLDDALVQAGLRPLT